MRLKMLRKVRTLIDQNLGVNQPVVINPPIPYTYRPKTKYITQVKRHRYYENYFKRTFTPTRIYLSDGTYVIIDKLKMKHLLRLYDFFTN
jgi:hypothetical protein